MRGDPVLRLPASAPLPIKVARIFNTYGPRMHPNDGRVVSNFIVQALLGRDITVYGEGLQTRSFCYVDDLIDGLIRLMARRAESPGRSTSAIRPSSRSSSSRTGGRFGRFALAHRRRPLPENDPKQRQPDISRARELLGWKPRVPLKEGS